MITLYQEVVTRSTKGVIGFGGDTTGKVIYIPVKTTSNKPVKFPDTIFTYEGWTCDYVNKKAYRWKGTSKEQIFYLDASLIDESNNIVDPDKWIHAAVGNQIKMAYYETCQYCSSTTRTTNNPSSNKKNIWLLSYQKEDGTEVYLYEFTYDIYDNILLQRSLPARIHTDAAPGVGNILSEVADTSDIEIEVDPTPEENPDSGYDDSGDETNESNGTDDTDNTDDTDDTDDTDNTDNTDNTDDTDNTDNTDENNENNG